MGLPWMIQLGSLSIAVLCTIGHAPLLGLEDGPPLFGHGVSNRTVLGQSPESLAVRDSLWTLFRVRLQGLLEGNPGLDCLNRGRSPLLPVSRLISVAGY